MSDAPPTTGLHHVTNICTDMAETRAFYEDVLGWHTVKRTQNYDDPETPHYDFSPTPAGEPGTNVTYFESHDVRVSGLRDRTDCTSIYFTDPDGLTFEIATEEPGFGVDESRRLSAANQNSPISGGVDEDEPGREVIDPYAEGYAESR